ncbi:molecular chaperone TorD [Shewanella sp. JBTF-M18]|uniref:Chaperone protein TorD n=1 Tax=Shewanella insulae TaxID=2681496 RepID=A0A6L7HX41_9GAMM|nr:molecular chaperone TorD [Shewanella insulae]MXR68703.1 molecular chaperone TorD [Shewanella insulae]
MNQTSINQTAQNQARARVYRLLSDLFAKEIDHQRLTCLQSSEAQAFFDLLATDPELAPEVNTLQEVLAGLNDEPALLNLAADYCGLFLVGGKQSANPYASLYLTPKEDEEQPLLFGDQHQEMMALLMQSQLQVQSDFPEPADHIAVILAYVAQQATRLGDKDQQAFIAQYLDAWLPEFAMRVSDRDSGRFYQALARLTQTWVRQDCEVLSA